MKIEEAYEINNATATAAVNEFSKTGFLMTMSIGVNVDSQTVRLILHGEPFPKDVMKAILQKLANDIDNAEYATQANKHDA